MATRTVRDGELSRESILDAAEELFARQGVRGASIRSINKAAGLSPAAVHYHFGSRDAVLDAVIQRQGVVVFGRINELADALIKGRRRAGVNAIVQIPATAYSELLERDRARGASWLRVIGQLSLSHEEHLTRISQPATVRLLELLGRAHPDASHAVLQESLTLAMTTFIQLVGQVPQETDKSDIHGQLNLLAQFVAGGLNASIKAGMKAEASTATHRAMRQSR